MDEEVEDFLAHFGVKGMRWGARKTSGSGGEGGPSEVHVVKRGKVLKTTGGKKLEPADDAVRAAVSKQKAKKSGTQALSNKEFQDMVTRMNMEQQYTKLTQKEKEARQNTVNGWLKKQAMDMAFKEAKKRGPELLKLGKAALEFDVDLTKIPMSSL
jgi:hypothetical protein